MSTINPGAALIFQTGSLSILVAITYSGGLPRGIRVTDPQQSWHMKTESQEAGQLQNVGLCYS